MAAHLTEPEIALRTLLGDGPRDSRAVLAAMALRQFSPKQARTAREKQNIIIERAGSGTDMRSTWRLPDMTRPEVEPHCGAAAGQDGGAFVPSAHAAPLMGSTVQVAAEVSTPATTTFTTESSASAALANRTVNTKASRERPAPQRFKPQPHALSPETQAIVQACRARGIPVTVRQVRVASVRTMVRTETPPAGLHDTESSAAPMAIATCSSALNQPPAASVPVLRAEPASRDSLQRSRDIGRMDHDELRAYAKQIGIRQRDIDDLTLDRLRQNCMLTVASLIEAYAA